MITQEKKETTQLNWSRSLFQRSQKNPNFHPFSSIFHYPPLASSIGTFKKPHHPPSTQECYTELLLQILWRALGPLPQANAHDSGEREEDTERDAQPPDGLHLVARRGIGTGPDEIVYFAHVGSDRGHEGRGAAACLGERGAVEVRERLADCDGDDDDGDQESGIEGGGDEEWEDAVPKENVRDGAIEDCYAGLEAC